MEAALTAFREKLAIARDRSGQAERELEEEYEQRETENPSHS